MSYDVQFADPQAMGAEIDARIAEMTALAQTRSPFHAKRLKGYTVMGRADLARLPVLEKDAWAKASPPHSTDALTGPLQSAYVFRSGGSTGEPKFAAFSSDEFRHMVGAFRQAYEAGGLVAGDRVANLFAAGNLYASFVFVNRLLEELGTLNFPMASAMPPEAVAAHARMFGINVLVGFPSWLLQVASAIEAEGGKIEKVFYAGEHLYDEERRYLERSLGATTISSAGYGAVDTGLMGYQCECASGTVHHLLWERVHFEIVDPETFEPVPTGETGLILVTDFTRRLHPVLRYNIGDLGRLIQEPCSCGRTAPRFELLQRGDDVLRIGYASVTYSEIVAAFAGAPGTLSAIQMVKTREAMRDRLLFRIEVRDFDTVTSEALEAALLAALLNGKPDIAKLIATNYIHPPSFEFLNPGEIPRLPVTGKLKRTLDLSR